MGRGSESRRVVRHGVSRRVAASIGCKNKSPVRRNKLRRLSGQFPGTNFWQCALARMQAADGSGDLSEMLLDVVTPDGVEAVPQPTIAERIAAAQAAEAERQAAATGEAGRQRCAEARDGCDRRDSDARRRCSPNWCAQPSPKRTPIAPRRAYELTYPCHCVCMSDCRSIHIRTGPGDRGRADGRPRGHRDTWPAAEMDSDYKEENWNWGGGGDFVFDETPRASALRTQRRPRRLMRRRHRLRL
eukprot:scaffold1878_cov113-Isochrysis_galbana.AAC.13